MKPPKPADIRTTFLMLLPAYGIVHFMLFMLLSVLFGHAAPVIPGALALPALGVEAILKATTNYRGEDVIQWPLIFANSLLYGFAAAIVHVLIRRRRRRGA